MEKDRVADSTGTTWFHVYYRWAVTAYVAIFLLVGMPLPVPRRGVMLGVVVAVLYNTLVTLFNRPIIRLLRRFPPLILIDMAFTAFLLVLTVPWRTPFWLYLYSPILLGAYYAGTRGGILVGAVWGAFYVAAETIGGYSIFQLAKMGWADSVPGDVVAAILAGAAIGYQGQIAERFRTSRAELAQAQDKLKSLNQRLEALQRLSASIQLGADVEKAEDTLLEALTHILGFDRASIDLFDEERNVLRGFRDSHVSPTWTGTPEEYREMLRELEVPLDSDQRVSALLMRERRAVNIPDLAADARVNCRLRELFGFRSAAFTPLVSADRVIGEVLVSNDDTGREITAEDMYLLDVFSGQAAAALENVMLHREEKSLLAEAGALRYISETMVDNAPMVVIFLDDDLNVVQANRQAEELLARLRPPGIPELPGSPLRDLVAEHGVTGRFDKARKTRRPVSAPEAELKLPTKDGTVSTYWDTTIAPLTDGSEVANGFIVTSREVTDDVLLKRRIEASERRYRRIFERAYEAVLLVDAETQAIVDANERAAELLGHTREELLSMKATEFQEPGEREAIAARDEERMKAGHGIMRNIPVKRKDGTKIVIDESMVFFEVDGRTYLYSSWHDITEQSRTQDELLRRNRELAALNAVAGVLRRPGSLKEVLFAALDEMFELLGVDGGGVYVCEGDDDELMLVAHRGISAEFARSSARAPEDERVLRGAFMADEPTVLVLDASQGEPRFKKSHQEALRAAVFVPLRVKGRRLGVMPLAWREVRRFTDEEVRFLQSIGEQVALTIEGSRLSSEAGRLAVAEERQRVAREVHDGLAQALGTIIYHLSAAVSLMPKRTEEAKQQILRLQKYAQRSLADVRDYIYDLRTLDQEATDPLDVLSRQVATFAQLSGIKVELESDGELGGMSTETSIALSRVMREALANILQHSRAHNVRVAVQAGDGHVTLEVADDGVGSDLPDEDVLEGKGSFGLIGMRERMEALGGDLLFDCRKGGGCRVMAAVPMRPSSGGGKP